MMKKIYLAGAMEACEGTDEAWRWRQQVKEYFGDYCENFECISPVDFYNYKRNIAKSGHEIMRFDLREVKEADVILVNLKDIRKSIGTSDEVLYAFVNNKRVIGFLEEDIEEEELVNRIHSWKYEQIDRIETGENALINACEYIKDYYF